MASPLAVRDALLATILYADIFDWPLTPEELRLWCIGTKPKALIAQKKSFDERRKREEWAKPKWEKARAVASVLSRIPSLTLIGVTGGLARNNAKHDDDIDLFFITKKGTIWASRLCAILLCELLGVRRRPGDTDVADKICLNMFMSEDALALPKNEQDLFAAYEVLQMVPLWKRAGTYRKFLFANQWVKKFLPNAWEAKRKTPRSIGKANALVLFRAFEPIAKVLQLWYMRKRRTSEIISSSILRFHPRDARWWIKEEFARRLSRHNLPLDKIFYGG